MQACNICKKKSFFSYKKINNYEIYVCNYCELALTIRKQSEINSDIKKNIYYDFESYNNFYSKYKNRFVSLIKVIKKFKKKGMVLEAGAGFGLFSSLLMKEYRVKVLEPFLEPFYLKKLSKDLICKTTIEEYLEKTNINKFDIIIFLDVLEHLLDPSEILKKVRKQLNKKGIIVIQLPNYKSLMAKLCNNWSWWMIEEHRYHFSPKALKLLLQKKGFTLKYYDTYEDFYDFKKNLDGNFTRLNNKIVRKLIKSLFYSFFIPIYFIFRKPLWSLGYGGLQFLIAEKK